MEIKDTFYMKFKELDIAWYRLIREIEKTKLFKFLHIKFLK